MSKRAPKPLNLPSANPLKLPKAERERLEGMMQALAAHAFAEIRNPHASLTSAMAVEIFHAIRRQRYGTGPRYRSTDEARRATCIARDMEAIFHCPQEQAVEAAYPNPNATDIANLCRNHRELLKLVGKEPLSGPADMRETMERYKTTEHYRRTWAKSDEPDA